MEKRILSINELAEEFGMSRMTVYRDMDRGMPYITVGKRRKFIYEEVLHWFRTKK